MKILVVGSGAGAHALAWKLAQSPNITKIFVAPGNPGTAIEKCVENIDVAANDIPGLALAAKTLEVDFTLVTPTPALAAGIVDFFEAEGLRVLSPNKEAAKLEWSKVYSKSFMEKHSIPTPAFRIFSDPETAKQYVQGRTLPLVLKVDGMANGGIGVIIARNTEDALSGIDTLFGKYGGQIIIEEFIEGKEVSFTILFDGETIIPLADSRDYKKLLNEDAGPNTSGMGAYSPVVSKHVYSRIMSEIVDPTIRAIKKEGINYLGFLYLGIIIDQHENISMLEINCRLGNPELFVILHRFTGDLALLFQQAVERKLTEATVGWSEECAVAVHLASEGYPFQKRVGDIISVPVLSEDIKIFHSSTTMDNGNLISKSGRVLAVSASGGTLEAARKAVYGHIENIRFDGMQYRTDIGLFNTN